MGALLVLEARPRYGGSEGEQTVPRESQREAALEVVPDRTDTLNRVEPTDPADLPDPTSFRAIDGAGDPFRIPDVIAELEDAIVTLSGHVHAANHRILCYLAELDRLEGWKLAGHRDCAEWLSFRTGREHGSAQEWVRTARALRRMPLTSAAMSRGELSFSKVRCLTRAVDDLADAAAARETAADSNEADDPGSPEATLVEFARTCTTAQLERAVPEWRALQVHDEAELERRCPWPPRRAGPRGGVRGGGGGGTGGGNGGGKRGTGGRGRRGGGWRRRDGGWRRRGGEGEGERDGRGKGERDRGAGACGRPRWRVLGGSLRRLSCDAATVRVTRGPEGEVLDIGRRSRTIHPALRRALEVRDGGCRFPGCALRFTEGHHIVHWADGGETNLANLVLLCRHHHRAVHEEGFRVRLESDGRVRFFDRVGWPLPDIAPPPPVLPDRPVEALVRANRRGGVSPGWDTPSARFRGEADIPWEMEARFREALDPSA